MPWLNKAAQGFVSEAYDFCQQTKLHPQKRLQQVQALAEGLVYGIGHEAIHHPKDVLWKTFSGATTGMIIGSVMMAESKRTALIGTICAAGIAGKWLVDKTNTGIEYNQKRDTAITSALDDLWKSNDKRSYKHNVDILSSNIGPAIFDLGQAATALWFAGRVTGGYKALLSRQVF